MIYFQKKKVSVVVYLTLYGHHTQIFLFENACLHEEEQYAEDKSEPPKAQEERSCGRYSYKIFFRYYCY